MKLDPKFPRTERRQEWRGETYKLSGALGLYNSVLRDSSSSSPRSTNFAQARALSHSVVSRSAVVLGGDILQFQRGGCVSEINKKETRIKHGLKIF